MHERLFQMGQKKPRQEAKVERNSKKEAGTKAKVDEFIQRNYEETRT